MLLKKCRLKYGTIIAMKIENDIGKPQLSIFGINNRILNFFFQLLRINSKSKK